MNEEKSQKAETSKSQNGAEPSAVSGQQSAGDAGETPVPQGGVLLRRTRGPLFGTFHLRSGPVYVNRGDTLIVELDEAAAMLADGGDFDLASEADRERVDAAIAALRAQLEQQKRAAADAATVAEVDRRKRLEAIGG